MSKKSKTSTHWREKLEKEDHSKIVVVPDRMAKRVGHGTMYIPRPLDVDSVMREVKKGKLIRPVEIRERLVRDNRVNVTCPLTTGIFIRIVAEAAEEDLSNGRKRVTPYWRVVRDDGSLFDRFPGGVQAQAKRLKTEGHSIEQAVGKKAPKVRDFERRLIKL